MIFAMSWRSCVSAFVIIVIVLTIASIAIRGEGLSTSLTADQLLNQIRFVSPAFIILISLLCVPWVFRLFHWLTFGKYWMFPSLDGEWTAELYSNWPLIKRMYKAAKNGGPAFDSRTDKHKLTKREKAEELTLADVTITSSLFFITMVLRPVGTDKSSRTRFVRPLWNKPDQPEISYVFKQVDPLPIEDTDEREHFGAGIIEYDEVTKVLTGCYWTDRSESAGLNTAGTIIMKKKPKKPVWTALLGS